MASIERKRVGIGLLRAASAVGILAGLGVMYAGGQAGQPTHYERAHHIAHSQDGLPFALMFSGASLSIVSTGVLFGSFMFRG